MKISYILIIIILIIIIISGVFFFPKFKCAKEGESFSKVYRNYPSSCCKGLKEWNSGFDTTISIEDKCYATAQLSGNPVGTCINCGNNICEEIENPCNCPIDCLGKEKSDYLTIQDFCDKKYDYYCKYPEEVKLSGSNICDLCS